MLVRERMKQVQGCIDVEAPLVEAAAQMASLGVGALPVSDGRRLVGLLTERDLVVRAMAQDADPASTPVLEVMTPGASTCFFDTPVWESLRVMELVGASWLVVLGHRAEVVGVLSRRDLDDLPSGSREAPRPNGRLAS